MALAVLPSKSFIKITVSGTADYWTSNLGFLVGDVITVTGSKFNDGVYLVSGFIQQGGSHYMMVIGKPIVDETSFSVNTDVNHSNGDTTINIVDSPDVRVGQTITGNGIPSGTVVNSVTGTEGVNVSAVVISQAVTGLGLGDGTAPKPMTFTTSPDGASTSVRIKAKRATGDRLCAFGDAANNNVDVWSFNKVSNPATTDDGWVNEEINTAMISSASEHVSTSQFIFTFSDEVLRVADINIENNSILKWYGYIQMNQFATANDSVSLAFNGWYEHPAYLERPASITMASSNQNAVDTDSHYNVLNDIVENEVGTDALINDSNNVTAITQDTLTFDTGGSAPRTANHFFEMGQVYSVLSRSSEKPECFMVRKTAEGRSDTTPVKVYRGYGGTTDAEIADNSGDIYKRGLGWNIGVIQGAGSGTWGAKQYEFFQTFIYDENQESRPRKYGGTLTTTDENKALKCTVYADRFYNGRITGGRIYIREAGSDNDLILFADIDIRLGARMTLDGRYVPWVKRVDTDANHTENSGYYSATSSSEGLKSTNPNFDTYKTLNGYSEEVKFNSIGKEKELYKASVIANRRHFIANVRIKNNGNTKKTHGDRIMFSELGKFDTFTEDNFIDVSRGDYGEYTALESFADKLLAFKHNTTHILNISSPTPSGWFLEESIKNSGVSFHYSMTKTEFGVVWANEKGCFLYNGADTINLTKNKLGIFESTNSDIPVWSDFANGNLHAKDVMCGYDDISNQLIVMRSPSDSSTNSNQCFIYDFDTKAWTYNTNLFTDSHYYTNFIKDWNNSLVVGKEKTSTVVEFKKYRANISSQGNQSIVTRDIDFGNVGLVKKIYKVIITYKSNTDQLTPLKFAINGTGSFSNFSTGSNITPAGNDSGDLDATSNFDIGVFKADNIVTCQSIQFKIDLPDTGTFEVNDITIQYRTLRVKEVS